MIKLSFLSNCTDIQKDKKIKHHYHIKLFNWNKKITQQAKPVE